MGGRGVRDAAAGTSHRSWERIRPRATLPAMFSQYWLADGRAHLAALAPACAWSPPLDAELAGELLLDGERTRSRFERWTVDATRRATTSPPGTHASIPAATAEHLRPARSRSIRAQVRTDPVGRAGRRHQVRAAAAQLRRLHATPPSTWRGALLGDVATLVSRTPCLPRATIGSGTMPASTITDRRSLSAARFDAAMRAANRRLARSTSRADASARSVARQQGQLDPGAPDACAKIVHPLPVRRVLP